MRSQKLVSRERKPDSEERAKESEKYLWRKAKEKAKLYIGKGEKKPTKHRKGGTSSMGDGLETGLSQLIPNFNSDT